MRGERFGELSCLKELKLSKCPNILWNGLVLPSSLLKLHLEDCGDISNYIPNCLVNLENLIRMSLVKLITIRSILAEIWYDNLSELQTLEISGCPDLISIGGPEAIEHIENAFVESCAKLTGLTQPLERGRRPPKSA